MGVRGRRLRPALYKVFASCLAHGVLQYYLLIKIRQEGLFGGLRIAYILFTRANARINDCRGYMGSMENAHMVQALASQARKEKKWVYSKSYKNWYDPDDFLKTFAMAGHSLVAFIKDCELRDPFEAIEEANQEIIRRQGMVEAFSARVVRYYQGKAVDPPVNK